MRAEFIILVPAFLAWLCAAVGMYRVVADAQTSRPYEEGDLPGAQDRARARMWATLFSPRHKVNLILIVAGGSAFVCLGVSAPLTFRFLSWLFSQR
jgi:hypothetical protein